MEEFLIKIQKHLKDKVDSRALENSQRFFKEKIDFYGVRIPVVHSISKNIFKELKGFEKAEIFKLCEELMKTGILEEAIIACDLSFYLHKRFVPDDFLLFERWINSYISNWASCDSFCTRTMNEFLKMYPGYVDELMRFTKSGNRWVRRAAAVSLVMLVRKGLCKSEAFKVAENLLSDKDDMVQKGYGWLLKVASQTYEKEVFDFVMIHKNIMSRTALRYAIEKMPGEFKSLAMKK